MLGQVEKLVSYRTLKRKKKNLVKLIILAKTQNYITSTPFHEVKFLRNTFVSLLNKPQGREDWKELEGRIHSVYFRAAEKWRKWKGRRNLATWERYIYLICSYKGNNLDEK